MKTVFYKLECLTNLHIGAGAENYSLVDEEVEKDPITGYPIIHASTFKGALRRHLSYMGEEALGQIFGTAAGGNMEQSGRYRMLDGLLLARPLRLAGSERLASVPTVTAASVNACLSRLQAFGCQRYAATAVAAPDFGGHTFLTTLAGDVLVEGEPTGKLDPAAPITLVRDLLGEDMAVAATFDGFDLPITARNRAMGGTFLWFEEMVPSGSVFIIGVLTEEDLSPLPLDGTVLQIGGHASVGCGYCRLTAL